MKFNESEWNLLLEALKHLKKLKQHQHTDQQIQLEIAEEFGPLDAVDFYTQEIKKTLADLEQLEKLLSQMNL